MSWAAATCRNMSAWLHGGKEIKRGSGLNGAKYARGDKKSKEAADTMSMTLPIRLANRGVSMSYTRELTWVCQ